MKTSMISLVALSLLAGGCGNEEGFEPVAENEEQLLGEESLDPVDVESLPLSPGIKGGPPRRVLKGKRSIVCAGIKWQGRDKPAATDGACNSLSRQLAEFYRDNSRGLFTLVPVAGHTVEVPYNASNSHLHAAEQIVVKTFNADFYVVPSVVTYPHAGSSIAHVKSAQFMTAAHETGHLLGLGHAGKYQYSAGGKVDLDAYGDHRSIMSNVFSNFLSPPQYYYQGWLPDDEVAMYDPAVDSYLVKQIEDFTGDGLATVIVPPVAPGGRWAFIGALRCFEDKSKTCMTLHLANGGGSQKIADSKSEIYDERFTGLHIKALEVSGTKVRISIDYATKP